MTYKEAALKLCDGFLDMPSGCDGCPLATGNYDDDGNMICELNDVNDVPVVRHGQWFQCDDDWNSLTTIQCSVCGEEYCFEYDEDI